MKHLRLRPYIDQVESWPERGRVILAQYDEETIVVYQATSHSAGRYAVRHGRLGGPGFRPERMIWIKTSFLWMMHRSGWGTRPGQTAVLAIWLRREAFDSLLAQAVHAQFVPELYESKAAWQAALEDSEVRLQWDPDHDPRGMKLRRRTIHLGLRGETLRRFASEWIVHIEDIGDLARQQAEYAHEPEFLLIPAERLYPVRDRALARRLQLDRSVP